MYGIIRLTSVTSRLWR